MHLSTAIVLMFAIVLIIWANIRGQTGKYMIWDGNGNQIHNHVYGWPYVGYNTIQQDMDLGWDIVFNLAPWVYHFLDFLVALVIVVSLWQICEKWIAHHDSARLRRTERR